LKNVQVLTKRLEEISDGAVVVTEEKPREGEAVPVMLDNPSFIKPFEAITRSYGVPGYYEVDPTIFLAVSFPLIFGMMFGDVGHGAIMTVIGVLVSRFRRNDAALSDFARIFTYCGISSVFFGFLYGSVFGLEDILTPIWFSPVHHLKEGLIKELLGLALFVGFLQMLLGILIDSANKAYSFGLRKTVAASAARILLFFGVISIITKLLGFPIPLFTSVVGVPLRVIAAVGFTAPAALILISEASHIQGKASLGSILSLAGDSAFEVLDSITMFLSNTISYSRIIILALIHAFLSEVIYVLGGLAGGIPYAGFVLYYVVVFAGTLVLVIGLEGLVVYVHTVRLHFYEWFTKFYGGGGVPYTPFKVTPRYIIQEKPR
jgi:V/A-type H+-transporting ATPase subunit I